MFPGKRPQHGHNNPAKPVALAVLAGAGFEKALELHGLLRVGRGGKIIKYLFWDHSLPVYAGPAFPGALRRNRRLFRPRRAANALFSVREYFATAAARQANNWSLGNSGYGNDDKVDPEREPRYNPDFAGITASADSAHVCFARARNIVSAH